MPDQTLLSVDDDPQILRLIRIVGSELNYHVEVVDNAGAFMTAYVRLKPSIVTLDICMPGPDGIELMRWLNDIGSTAKVVIVSGSHPQYAEMARRLAAASGTMEVGILRKPFRMTELREALMIDPLIGASAEA